MILSFQTANISPRYGDSVPPLPVVVAAAAEAGFPAVGLDLFSVQTYLESGQTVGDVTRQLENLGLACSDVIALVCTDDQVENLRVARQLASLAQESGASTCVATLGPEALNLSWQEVCTNLRQCASVLADSGARIALEWVPYLGLRSLPEAAELCSAIGWERAGLALDPFHVFTSGDIERVEGLQGAQIAFVQFCDGRLPAARDLVAESRYHRLLPGDGNLDLARFVRAVVSAGYEGTVSAEVLATRIRTGEPRRVAHEIATRMAEFWDSTARPA